MEKPVRVDAFNASHDPEFPQPQIHLQRLKQGPFPVGGQAAEKGLYALAGLLVKTLPRDTVGKLAGGFDGLERILQRAFFRPSLHKSSGRLKRLNRSATLSPWENMFLGSTKSFLVPVL
jgi:hypothetical protein